MYFLCAVCVLCGKGSALVPCSPLPLAYGLLFAFGFGFPVTCDLLPIPWCPRGATKTLAATSAATSISSHFQWLRGKGSGVAARKRFFLRFTDMPTVNCSSSTEVRGLKENSRTRSWTLKLLILKVLRGIQEFQQLFGRGLECRFTIA